MSRKGVFEEISGFAHNVYSVATALRTVTTGYEIDAGLTLKIAEYQTARRA